MVESLVLLATVVAVLAAAVATYGRLQARRSRILSTLKGEHVTIQVREGGGALRFLYYVEVRVLAVPDMWSGDARVQVDVIDFDDRTEPVLRAPGLLGEWEE
ncbi:MAG TPA: hypothetical protein VEO00_12860, partial [Actinomycetota bacterium]|nr:hypothetical protein [Actinomycetota bacterium]